MKLVSLFCPLRACWCHQEFLFWELERPLRHKTVKSGLPSKLMGYLVTHLVLLFWWRKMFHRSLWIIAFTLASETLPKILKEVLSSVLKVTLYPSQGPESLPCQKLLLKWECNVRLFSIAEKFIDSPKNKSQSTGGFWFHLLLHSFMNQDFQNTCNLSDC